MLHSQDLSLIEICTRSVLLSFLTFAYLSRLPKPVKDSLQNPMRAILVVIASWIVFQSLGVLLGKSLPTYVAIGMAHGICLCRLARMTEPAVPRFFAEEMKMSLNQFNYTMPPLVYAVFYFFIRILRIM